MHQSPDLPPWTPWYSDAEVDAMCEGLTQDAARIRFMRRLGLEVDRRPNGKPLAWRPGQGPRARLQGGAAQPPGQAPADGPADVVRRVQQVAAAKKAKRAAQGRRG